MRNVFYVIIGVVFGLALTKGEAISWFRMQEMFRLEGFHMYGIFMTAVPTAAISIMIIRRLRLKSVDKEEIVIPPKPFDPGVILGSLIFGFGWCLTGACPGPLYAQIGSGFTVVIVTFLSALAGTWTFGLLQKYLP